jgi:hypothetical protein
MKATVPTIDLTDAEHAEVFGRPAPTPTLRKPTRRSALGTREA